jgi:hypothetical protein
MTISTIATTNKGFVALLPVILISLGLVALAIEIQFDSYDIWYEFRNQFDKDQVNRLADNCFQESLYQFKQQKDSGVTSITLGNQEPCTRIIYDYGENVWLINLATFYNQKAQYFGLIKENNPEEWVLIREDKL